MGIIDSEALINILQNWKSYRPGKLGKGNRELIKRIIRAPVFTFGQTNVGFQSVLGMINNQSITIY